MDQARSTRPPYERIIIAVLGVAAFGAAVAGAWWLWSQSGVGVVIRDGSPNWSPDGHVVFSSEENGKANLVLTDRTGGHRTPLTFPPGNAGGAAYSPDGTQMAFHSDRDGNLEIYVMNSNGVAARRLTNDPGIDQAPAWSRDGRQIVFMSNRVNKKDFDIFRMDADGSNLERLTTSGSNWFPQYAPDGSQLALQIGRDIYIMSLATRQPRRLTHEPLNGMYPTWSRDGERIAFMSWRNGPSQIFTANADGSDPKAVVTMPSGDAIDPRWSPDGKYIAFVHVPKGGVASGKPDPRQQHIVFVVELGTGRLQRISR